MSLQYLGLAPAGLPCGGCGPLPGLHALLAAGLHDTCGEDERSHAAHHPAHGTGGHPCAQTGKGTTQKTLVVCTEIPQKQLKNWPPLFQIRCESRVLLCCYRAVNVYYYKYTVHGINIFALSILSFLRSWINFENVSSIGQNISFSPFPLSQ